MASSLISDIATEPYFPKDAAVRRINREGVLILGGGRALLMQIAHPSVARGVAEHSSYQTNRTDRLLRTLRATLAIAFGTREEALAAAGGINRLHQRVNGEGYDAFDPELLVWVLATLIDTALVMHESFVGPIEDDDKARYYEEMSEIGRLLGVASGAMPKTVGALQVYVEEMSRTLVVSDAARSIAADLLAPLPRTGPAMAVMRQFTSGILHPALRSGFGLTWGPIRETQFRGLQAVSRFVLPKTPMGLRQTPAFLLPPSAAR